MRYQKYITITMMALLLAGIASSAAQQSASATRVAQAQDPFAQTATQVVLETTQTALASTNTPIVIRTGTPTFTPSPTSVIVDVTAGAQAEEPILPEDNNTAALSLTAVIFGGLVVVLLVVGLVFIALNSRDSN